MAPTAIAPKTSATTRVLFRKDVVAELRDALAVVRRTYDKEYSALIPTIPRSVVEPSKAADYLTASDVDGAQKLFNRAYQDYLKANNAAENALNNLLAYPTEGATTTRREIGDAAHETNTDVSGARNKLIDATKRLNIILDAHKRKNEFGA